MYNDRSGNQEWTIQRRYQSRVECTMAEVAMKNGQSRDVTRVGQSVKWQKWQSRIDNLETLLEQGRVYNDRGGNQEWTIQRRYQSRVECKMTEVAIKN